MPETPNIDAPSNPRPRLPASSPTAIDAALETLADHRRLWPTVPILEKIELLRATRRSFAEVADEWVETCVEIAGFDADAASDQADAVAGENWITGPYLVLRNLRLLQIALRNVSVRGVPRIPGPIRRLPDGRTAARVFPYELSDRLFYPGVTAEVWMRPGVTPANLDEHRAIAYRDGSASDRTVGGTCLVMSAGNVSSIGPMDTLSKLFVDGRTVVYKTHPVNDRLGPLLERGFRPLVQAGYLRVLYGGAETGARLCEHDLVDEIHVTGSDSTYEAIVFGAGEEGRRRKARGESRLKKPVSAELGNVSPVVVVPGRWSDRGIAYQAENVAAMLANNAGFNCNALRVLVTWEGWPQRQRFLSEVRDALRRIPTRPAYYRGAEDRHERFLDAHPEATRIGDAGPGELPWTVVEDVDPTADDLCFSTESFCSLACETALAAPTAADFVARAVEFCNERLWGTLNATLLVPPDADDRPDLGRAVEEAIGELRYGTVAINHWAALGYGLVVTPWGAWTDPEGAEPNDIQSGVGFVHNTLMFSRIERCVIRAPFVVRPRPPWFPTHDNALGLGRRLTSYERRPNPLKLPGIVASALRA